MASVTFSGVKGAAAGKEEQMRISMLLRLVRHNTKTKIQTGKYTQLNNPRSG